MTASRIDWSSTMGYSILVFAWFSLKLCSNTVISLSLHHDRRSFLSDGTTTMLAIGSWSTTTSSTPLTPVTTTTTVPQQYHDTQVVQYNNISYCSSMVTVPLLFTGKELLVEYQVDGSIFKAVLDTGSPFLMIPGSCGFNTQRRSGCYMSQGRPTVFENTIEIFDNFEGEVEWRQGSFEFVNAILPELPNATTMNPSCPPPLVFGNLKAEDETQRQSSRSATEKPAVSSYGDVIFGVASENIMSGPGGVFFGMIRDTDARIRPSFLSQSNVKSFQVDMKARPRTLTLSTTSIVGISKQRQERRRQRQLHDQDVTNFDSSSLSHDDPDEEDYKGSLRFVPLSTLLRRRYGDPVQHYTVRATSIDVDGYVLASDDGTAGSRPLLVIIDTGVTGMVVSRELFNQQYENARRRKAKNLFGVVSLSINTRTLKSQPLSSSLRSSLSLTTTKYYETDRSAGSSSANIASRTVDTVTKDHKSSMKSSVSESSDVVKLSATKPLATPFDPEETWKRLSKRNANNGLPPPHLIVLGLAFLENRTITIDIDDERLWVT